MALNVRYPKRRITVLIYGHNIPLVHNLYFGSYRSDYEIIRDLKHATSVIVR